MRIHTNRLDASLIRGAVTVAQANIETLSEHGSRTHKRAFEFKLTGNSRRRPNGGSYGARDAYAATWDQWGVVLGLLFDIDPEMRTSYDRTAEGFHFRTGGRFKGLDAEHIEIPLNHDHTFRATGVVCERQCTKCDAVERW